MECSVPHLSLVKKNYNSQEQIEKLQGKIFSRVQVLQVLKGLNISDLMDVSTLTFVKMCMKKYALILNGMPQKYKNNA
jgi:hypothetical protein